MDNLETRLLNKGIIPNKVYICSRCKAHKPPFALLVVDSTVVCTACLVEQKRESTEQRPSTIADLRSARDSKLAACDWTQLADVPAGIKRAYRIYRKQLRDITDSYNTLENVVWPISPAEISANNGEES